MHAVHKMQPVAADVARSMVCLSVYWPRVSPGQSPLIPPLLYFLLYRLVSFSLFLLASSVFLLFPSLPILPELSHSVYRPDVVGGD